MHGDVLTGVGVEEARGGNKTPRKKNASIAKCGQGAEVPPKGASDCKCIRKIQPGNPKSLLGENDRQL